MQVRRGRAFGGRRQVLTAFAPRALAALSGCSYSLFQTAHTQPPGKVTATAGIGHYTDPTPPEPGWHYAARTGSGDGLLQLNVCIEMPLAAHFALLVEYAHWFVLQDDPGDYYNFVPTNVLGVGVRF